MWDVIIFSISREPSSALIRFKKRHIKENVNALLELCVMMAMGCCNFQLLLHLQGKC